MKDCNNCGKCCTKYPALQIEQKRYDDWMKKGLFHIAETVSVICEDVIDAWFDEDGEELDLCPHYVKTDTGGICGIYEDRPEVCRSYPVDIEQMIRDECEMLEKGDTNAQL